MNGFFKLVLLGLGVYGGVKLYDYLNQPTEAELFQRAAREMEAAVREALKAKAREAPMSLSGDEIRLLGSIDANLLGEIIAGLDQEAKARFLASYHGQAYMTPDDPVRADPSFVGPPLPS